MPTGSSSDNKTVLRGGFGIFHPTGAAQGARDIMSRNPFRYSITNRRGDAAARLHDRHADLVAQLRQPGPRSSNLQSPDIYQYNLTLERELPGEHRRSGQLHRIDDAEAAGDA